MPLEVILVVGVVLGCWASSVGPAGGCRGGEAPFRTRLYHVVLCVPLVLFVCVLCHVSLPAVLNRHIKSALKLQTARFSSPEELETRTNSRV